MTCNDRRATFPGAARVRARRGIHASDEKLGRSRVPARRGKKKKKKKGTRKHAAFTRANDALEIETETHACRNDRRPYRFVDVSRQRARHVISTLDSTTIAARHRNQNGRTSGRAENNSLL